MARRAHTLYVEHLTQDSIEREGLAAPLAEFQGTGWRPHSLISVALRARERVIGTLTIARDAHPESYGREDRLLAESLAEWAAFKIENARLYQNLQETIETLETKARELAGANSRLREEFEQRSRMSVALAASEAKLRAVLDTAVDAIVTIERNGNVQSFNKGAEGLFGYAPEEVIGRDVTTLMPKTYWIEESDLERMIGPCREAMARRKDGSTFPAEVSVSRVDLAEGEVLYTVILRDITERKRAAEEAHRAAFEDPLTGLANRRLLLDHLEQAVMRSERTSQCTGVLYLDLDRFSVTNDALGHGVGDQILKLVGNRLRMVMRPQDTVARIGSDEFVFLLEDMEDAKQAIEMGQRLIELLRVPLFVGGQELFLSASIGIAIKSAESESAQDLMRFAEMALRRAKEKGRARCVLFDEAERAALTRELPQEYDLHRALDQGEFEIRFQPIVDLKTMKTVALEALLRWNWRGQLLSPVAFIEMAEESGMIVPIGEWVLRTAARSVREWDKEHGTRLPLRVHVNVSARQLNDMTFPDRIEQILAETGFMASRLSLELTETTLIEDPERARTQLTRIADLGVKLAIDDFGTGYSSLTYLMAYPVHEVKIDKSFVQDINAHATRATLVESIIHLTHRLGMKVVAEGVETEDQLRPLVGFGCDLAQGYLFGRPIPADAIRAQLRQIFPLVDRVR
jgi:diguanylate cyclase (GGDEF)-like protein/PAS domain S-box-containing protein